jgi:aminoglycoside/choline kinase family phosphotransferase
MDYATRLQTLLPDVHRFLRREWQAEMVAPVEAIAGQASNRRYYRLALSQGAPAASMILVQLPPDPYESDEATTGVGQRELPFCAMLRYLESRDLPVPRLYADCTDSGFLLQEDLGQTTLFHEVSKASPDQWLPLYREAVSLLVTFQRATVAPNPEDPCIGFTRRFDASLLRWELDHFKEWLLLDHAGAALTVAENHALDALFDELVRTLADSEYRLAHRDYQSTNLMLKAGKLVLIDFQDALLAPPMYDLVALLRDSYVPLPDDLLSELLSHYYGLAADLLPFPDEATMREHFHLQTVQRKLKDAGRFIFIHRVKGNPGFLQWVDPTLNYVANALEHIKDGPAFQELLGPHVPALARPKTR